MKSPTGYVFHVLLGSLLFTSSLSGRTLSPAEIQALLQELTSQPRQACITTGEISGHLIEESWPNYSFTENEINSRIQEEIQAFKDQPPRHLVDDSLRHDHLEAIPYNVRYAYRASEQKDMTMILRCLSGKYYWETNLNSFKDLADLKDQTAVPYRLTAADEAYFANTYPAAHACKRFNPAWNQQRTYAWDGQELIKHTYASSGRINHAVRRVKTEDQIGIPSPLTEGMILWGQGMFTLENLQTMNVNASEVWSDGGPTTTLTISRGSGLGRFQLTAELSRVKDPQGKSSLLLKGKTITRGNELSLRAQLSGHTWVEGAWIATQIVTEQTTSRFGAERTLRKTMVLNINTQKPSAHMRPEFEGAAVEYRAPGLAQPIRYRMSDVIDTEALLTEKIALGQQRMHSDKSYQVHNQRISNCATLSLGYATRQLGYPIDEQALTNIIKTDGTTTLSDMTQLIQQKGLYAQAVRGDLDSLALLPNCQIILHLPGKQHFIVLGDIDSTYVWCIDLSTNNVLYRVEKNSFILSDWANGVALIISTAPLDSIGQSIEPISDKIEQSLRGSANTDCVVLVQEFDFVTCGFPNPACDGYAEVYFEIWTCGTVQYTCSCSKEPELAAMDCPCVIDPANPEECVEAQDENGDYLWAEWYYLDACQS